MSSIDRLYKVMQNLSSQTNIAPSQMVSLKVRTLDPLEFTHNDKLVISEEFYKLDRNFSSASLNVGDYVSAMMLNDGQTYYLLANVSGGGGGGGTNNYNELENKPSINNVTLKGNKTTAELGIIIPTKTSELQNDSGFGTYTKPNTGIPKSDLSNSVQTSLSKADTAIQSHQDITGKEDKTNKVTSISSGSTDTQYPSAKLVYDQLALKQDTLTAGTNITISNNVISATGGGTTYTAGTNIQISDQNVISATDTTYSAGTGISITSGVISSTVDISGKEDTSNKVTSITSSSTDTQYPSAKCVYDALGQISVTAITTAEINALFS